MASFRELENNLKTFLIDSQSDAHNVKTMSSSRYNNIKITMDPKKTKQKHVTIKMGMSEAVFSLDSFENVLFIVGLKEAELKID